MKNVLILISILFIVGCSKDDDNNSGADTTKKYLERVSLTNSNNDTHEILFTYNSNKQIIGYTRGTITELSYDYDQRKLIRINDTGLNNIPYQFFYTNTILSGIKHYDNAYPATYNQADNSYNFEGGNLKIGVTGNDLAYVDENNGNNIYTFNYNALNKGPMHDVSMDSPFLLPLFSESTFLFLTSMPISQVRINDNGIETLYNAVNTFDNDGYVTSIILRSASEELLRAQFIYTTTD